MKFKVIVSKGEDFGYVVECPALPGCVSQGDTVEEALENIKEAIQAWLIAEYGDEIPDQIKQPQEIYEVAI
ncbi:MAG: type II toxin-antitoxin system HicB family antitoxin [bacterium]